MYICAYVNYKKGAREMTFLSNTCVRNIMVLAISLFSLLIGFTGPRQAEAEPVSANIQMSLEANREGQIRYYELELAADGSIHVLPVGTDDSPFYLLDIMVSGNDPDREELTVLRVNSFPDPEDPRHLTSVNSKDMIASICGSFVNCQSYSSFVIESFDWNILAGIEKINPAIQTCAMYSQQPAWGRNGEILRPYEKEKSPYLAGLHIDKFKGNAVWAAHSLGIDMVAPYYKDITLQQIEDAEALGMKVRPWKSPEIDTSSGGISPTMAALLSQN